MRIFNTREPFLLFCGDIVCFVLSLFLALSVRAGVVPSWDEFLTHLVPFSFLFVLWFIVFFIAGLYEKHTTGFRFRLPGVLLRTQIINTVLAALFFYTVPIFGLAPKVVLVVYLFISFFVVLLWRLYGELIFTTQKRERALIIGSGQEMKAVVEEIKMNKRYGIEIADVLDFATTSTEDIHQKLSDGFAEDTITVVIIAMENRQNESILPFLYKLLFRGVRYMDLAKVYEDLFNRVPLDAIDQRAFLETLSRKPHASYDFLKHLTDTVISFVLGIASLLLYPFVMLAILFEDGRPFFLSQERVGKNNKPIRIIKFRSMSVIDDGVSVENKSQKITRVGKVIRRLRIDELPQLWNVVRGELSLIGPRPELPAIAKTYEAEIPYYGVRHMITPGLSGWAQIYHDEAPKFGVAVEQTKAKLSYDLYYIKNRSFLLDFKIALKTIKTLLSRSGV